MGLKKTTTHWDLVLELHGRIGSLISPAAKKEMVDFSASFNCQPGHLFHFVYVIENFDPQNLSAAAYALRDPFYSPEVEQKKLGAWCNAGWVEENRAGSYGITKGGTAVQLKRWQVVQQALHPFTLNDDDIVQLCLKELAETVANIRSLPNGQQRHNFNQRRERGLKPPIAICPLLQLIEYRMDLGAFRDDTHLAAWIAAAPDLPPLAWEIMSLVWDGRWHDQTDLMNENRHRGFAGSKWQAAVSDLLAKQLITSKENAIQMTETGSQAREKVELFTNESFFAPWKGPKPALLHHLIEQLERNQAEA